MQSELDKSRTFQKETIKKLIENKFKQYSEQIKAKNAKIDKLNLQLNKLLVSNLSDVKALNTQIRNVKDEIEKKDRVIDNFNKVVS